MENKRPNPIALTEQDITTYGRPTVIGFHDRNDSETLFPGTTHKDLLLKKYPGWEPFFADIPQYNDALSVCKQLIHFEQQHLPYVLKRAFQESVLNNMSEDMRKNPKEMLGVISFRPDALLYADKSIQSADFLAKAIQYNPNTRKMFFGMPGFDGVYHKTMFGENQRRHPVWDDITKWMKKEQSVWAPVRNIDPTYRMSAELATATYRSIFSKVLVDPVAHKFSLPTPETVRLSAVAAVRNLAWLKQNNPSCAQEFNQIEKDEYAKARDQLKQLAQAPENSILRNHLAEFCHKHDLQPEPEWSQEYQQATLTFQRAEPRSLVDIAIDNIQTTKEQKTYPQDAMFAVKNAMSSMAWTQINKRMDIAEFWQDVGQAVTEARSRLKTNNYPQNKSFSPAKDKQFIQDVQDITVNAPQRQLIRAHINEGIKAAQQRSLGLNKQAPQSHSEVEIGGR